MDDIKRRDTARSTSTPERNRAAYSSEEAVERYSESAAEQSLFQTERRVLDRYFSTDSGTRVLDLGCGAGRTTQYLADRGFDVTGIDLSEEMIRRARELFPGLDVRVGDAADVDFPDSTFDYVLFSYSGLDLVHPERERLTVLREIRRVLKPGGLFAFSAKNSLYLLPALTADWSHLLNYYVRNGNFRRLFRRYKLDDSEYGVLTSLRNPLSQRRQLRREGFEFVACVGKRDGPLRLLENQPYYVARKPERRGEKTTDESHIESKNV